MTVTLHIETEIYRNVANREQSFFDLRYEHIIRRRFWGLGEPGEADWVEARGGRAAKDFTKTLCRTL
jgi:hypothetical protein